MTTSQKQAARKFVERWTFRRGSEKGEDQQFWNSLLRDVLGVADVEQHIKYQVPVQLKDTTKFLDAWIPETRVLIEHKSRGVNLDAPQSGHGGLTPYEQAVEYDNARSFDEKARWIVTCNFDEFRIYDRAKPLAPPLRMGLGDLAGNLDKVSADLEMRKWRCATLMNLINDSHDVEVFTCAREMDEVLIEFGSLGGAFGDVRGGVWSEDAAVRYDEKHCAARIEKCRKLLDAEIGSIRKCLVVR